MTEVFAEQPLASPGSAKQVINRLHKRCRTSKMIRASTQWQKTDYVTVWHTCLDHYKSKRIFWGFAKFCLVLELPWGGSATNRATLASACFVCDVLKFIRRCLINCLCDELIGMLYFAMACTNSTRQHRTWLKYSALNCTWLRYTTLHCNTQHYTALHCTLLHYTSLHYTTLNCPKLH